MSQLALQRDNEVPKQPTGKWAQLRRTTGSDLPLVAHLFDCPAGYAVLGLPNGSPALEAAAHGAMDQAYISMVIVQRRTGKPCGWFAAFDFDAFTRSVRCVGGISDEFRGRGWPWEGFLLALEHLAAMERIRSAQIRFFPQVGHPDLRRSALFEDCGALREHEFINGRYVDECYVSVSLDRTGKEHSHG